MQSRRVCNWSATCSSFSMMVYSFYQSAIMHSAVKKQRCCEVAVCIIDDAAYNPKHILCRRSAMLNRAKLILGLIFLSLMSFQVMAHHIVIRGPWIPEAPPVSKVLAAFMVVENTSAQNEEIIGVESADFGHIEMHLSKEVDGVAKMIPQESLVIPAKGQLVLKPGSYHLMLFKPKRALKAGDNSELVIKLKSGSQFSVKFKVKQGGGMMMHNHDHH
ncbi:MAG: copper chaperone PCu(A)C [Gammaproteobacteria bacterium]|nr:MAG: copper chaperone PCu(A)C [Gammaproteobacteria bacterium]